MENAWSPDNMSILSSHRHLWLLRHCVVLLLVMLLLLVASGHEWVKVCSVDNKQGTANQLKIQPIKAREQQQQHAHSQQLPKQIKMPQLLLQMQHKQQHLHQQKTH